MVIVLCYHRISNCFDDFNLMNVSIDNFRDQMMYISKMYQTISLAEVVNEDINDTKVKVAVTFDDGYADVYENVLPILEKYSVPATVFITTDNIDSNKENWPDEVMRCCIQPCVFHSEYRMNNSVISTEWNTSSLQGRIDLYNSINAILSRLPNNIRSKEITKLREWAGYSSAARESRRILTSLEIEELSKNSLITIGSHTQTHPLLSYLDRREIRIELEQSKRKLEKIVGEEIDFFAYPYGGRQSYDLSVIKILKELGYKKAFTTMPKNIDANDSMYTLPRCVVYNYALSEFTDFINSKLNRDNQCREVDKINCYGETINYMKYVGYLKKDKCMIYSNNPIIIWGAGYWGKKLYRELEEMGEEKRVIGVGDKNRDVTFVNNIPILTYSEVKKINKTKNAIVLVKGEYDWEICNDLIKHDIKNIHLIMREN